MFEDDIRRFKEIMRRTFEELDVPEGFGGRMVLPYGGNMMKYRKPFADIIETEKNIIVAAEMPGLNKEDIVVNITEDKLEISSKIQEEVEKKDIDYIYRERRTGNFHRIIPLSKDVDIDNTKATYNNGILEIKMPKKEIKNYTPIKIE